MGKPPDRIVSMRIDKTKKMSNVSSGPKYLIMKRVNSENTLAQVSPFLLKKKTIDYVCGGEIDCCKKLRNGNILLKTKTLTQAIKLVQLTALTPEIEIEITEHTFLNSSKGVIYAGDLIGTENEEIMREMQSQSVSEIKKIMKKIGEKQA